MLVAHDAVRILCPGVLMVVTRHDGYQKSLTRIAALVRPDSGILSRRGVDNDNDDDL